MAEKTRAQLKALFETDDVILEDSMTDYIDSNLNLIDTTAQSFASTISAPGVNTHTVSAVNNYSTNTFGHLERASAMQSKPPFIELISKKIGQSAAIAPMTILLPATVDTPVAVSCHASALTGNKVGFTFTTAGRMTYTGAVTASFLVSYNMSLYINTVNNQNCTLMLYKNGAELLKARKRFSTIGDQYEFVQARQVVKMATNDFVEPYLECNTTANLNWFLISFNAVAFPLHWDH